MFTFGVGILRSEKASVLRSPASTARASVLPYLWTLISGVDLVAARPRPFSFFHFANGSTRSN